MLLAEEILSVALSAWLIVGTHRWLVLGGFGRVWRFCFFLLICLGIALAFRLMGFRYLESPTSRAYGVPFVIAGGDLIEGKWRDGGVGLYMPLPMLADLAVGIALCLVPLAAILFFRLRGIQRGALHVA